jgi:hypothetical protein
MFWRTPGKGLRRTQSDMSHPITEIEMSAHVAEMRLPFVEAEAQVRLGLQQRSVLAILNPIS